MRRRLTVLDFTYTGLVHGPALSERQSEGLERVDKRNAVKAFRQTG